MNKRQKKKRWKKIIKNCFVDVKPINEAVEPKIVIKEIKNE